MQKDEAAVREVKQAIATTANPFDSPDNLSSLLSGVVASTDIEKDLLEARDKGEKLFQNFVNKRLINQRTDFFATLPRNNLRHSIQHRAEIKGIRADRDLFAIYL
jgi:F0F1-type ATP synthase delta subunit